MKLTDFDKLLTYFVHPSIHPSILATQHSEFVYGPTPSETFTGKLFFPDQGQPSRFYFWVKQHLFPYVYWNLLPQGKWFGRQLLTPYDFSGADAKKA